MFRTTVHRESNDANRYANLKALPAAAQQWPLDMPLLQLDRKSRWLLRDAVMGVSVTGGTGAGKTTSTGRMLAEVFLKSGFGALVLCVKPGEAQRWIRLSKMTGRSKSVIHIRPDNGRAFNFLDYEIRRSERPSTHNLVSLFMRIMEAIGSGGDQAGSSNEQFWRNATKEMLGNLFACLYGAWGRVTMDDVGRFIASTPVERAQVKDDKWREGSFCFRTLQKLNTRPAVPMNLHDVRTHTTYFTERWADADAKMRTGIEYSLSSFAHPFLTGTMRECFAQGTNVIPEMALEGNILLVDFPIKTEAEEGQLAANIWKYLFQRACERRNGEDDAARPVFLWADEAHLVVNPGYDLEFQSTARSSKCVTVYLTQSISTYHHFLRSKDPKALTTALLNNLQTHFYHQNSDPETNAYAADRIGKIWQWVQNAGVNSGENTNVGLSRGGSSGGGSSGNGMQPATQSSSWSSQWGFNEGKGKSKGQSHGISQQLEHAVLPSTFINLRMGGGKEPPEVIMVQGGRVFETTALPCIRLAVPQG